MSPRLVATGLAYVLAVGVIMVAASRIGGALRAPAVTEDSPGWDCLRQGNVTCRIDGVLVTSLEGMPDDPYGRCVFLLGISERVGGMAFTVCDEKIWENQG